MTRPRTGRHPNIIRGRMSDVDRAEIERLATTMTNPTAAKIAQRINRHPATVRWYMLTRGLIDQKPKSAPRAYVRNGSTIHPYTAVHDQRIEQLRTAGDTYREIAEKITVEFGISRTGHSVQVRMIQLAASPDIGGLR